jgi:two-component system response regulator NreC
VTELIRVLIADDHTIVRSGIRLLLEEESDIDVVGEAVDGREVLKLVEDLHPQVILMDIAMPKVDGMEATRQIKAHWPEINVLVLTMHRSDDYFFEMIKAGASGYLLKGAETNELIDAIRIVARGEVYLYPTMAQMLVQEYVQRIEGNTEANSLLSPREIEILRMLAEGYSNNEIATNLVISPSTVHTHRRNLMNKLGFTNRRELIEYARQQGIIKRT